MKQAHNFLSEIIWELTLKCNKNCDYCGSKEYLNKLENYNDALNIALEIIKYPPEEITLSGGEPILHPYFEEIVNILHSAGIKVKVLTNGTLLDDQYSFDINKLTAVGLSINTKKDLEIFSQYPASINSSENKITIITNFGNHNIFSFEKLYTAIKDRFPNFTWQIQLTMGDKYQLNNEGINFLYKQIQEVSNTPLNLSPILQSDNGKIVLADNLQLEHQCSAGKNSLGILYNGDIVNCLSMRSWCKAKDIVQGNLLKDSLETIWKTKFIENRFGKLFCCRDCIEYPNFEPIENKNEPTKEYLFEELEKEIERFEKKNNRKIVTLYGVTKPDIYIYGVSPNEPIITMYAVWTESDSNPIDILSTTTYTKTYTNIKDIENIGKNEDNNL